VGPVIMTGPTVMGGCPGGSEAGLTPELSRNCEASPGRTSQVA
jgi:hypothetical protein